MTDLVMVALGVGSFALLGAYAALAGDEAAEPIPRKTVRTRDASRRLDWIPYTVALLAVLAALATAKLIEPLVGVESLDLAFLTAVVAIAVRFGLGPSLFAVVGGSLSYNFFCTRSTR